MCHDACDWKHKWQPEAQETRYCEHCRLWQHVKCLQEATLDLDAPPQGQEFFRLASILCVAHLIEVGVPNKHLDVATELRRPIQRVPVAGIPLTYEIITIHLRDAYRGGECELAVGEGMTDEVDLSKFDADRIWRKMKAKLEKFPHFHKGWADVDRLVDEDLRSSRDWNYYLCGQCNSCLI